MLTIRMQRTGRTGHAQFRVVAQDKRFSPKSGRVTAYLGNYDPHTKTAQLDGEKIASYLDKGAQPSPRVIKLLKTEGIKLPKWVSEAPVKKKSTRNPEKLRKNRPAEPKEAAKPAEPKAEEPTADTPAEEPKIEEPTETPAEQPAEEAPTEDKPAEEPKAEAAPAEEPKAEAAVEDKPAEG